MAVPSSAAGGPWNLQAALQAAFGRVCGPLANSLFDHRPQPVLPLPAKIEAAYHQADQAIQKIIDLLAA